MGKNRILKGVYMNQLIKMDEEYRKWIEDIGKRYKQRQIKASVSVNQEMIGFYWSIGRDIVEKSAESKWGSGSFVISCARSLCCSGNAYSKFEIAFP